MGILESQKQKDYLKELKSAGGLIPQVFYDVIARLSLGLILLMTVGFFWSAELAPGGWAASNAFIQAGFSVAIAALLAAYALSFVMEGILELPATATKLLSSRRQQKASRDRWAGARARWQSTEYSLRHPESPPSNWVIEDMLRIIAPGIGARIVKLRAEHRFCQKLALGWILIAAGRLVHVVPQEDIGLPLLIMEVCTLLVGAWLVHLRGANLKRKYKIALYNNWLLLVSPGYETLLPRTRD